MANFFGPVEGRKHDCGDVKELWSVYSTSIKPRGQTHNTLCTYGDQAYSLIPQLLGHSEGAGVTQIQQERNQAMNKVRINVG